MVIVFDRPYAGSKEKLCGLNKYAPRTDELQRTEQTAEIQLTQLGIIHP
jgi:hypothetical protein